MASYFTLIFVLFHYFEKLLEWIVKNIIQLIHSKEIGPVVVADKKDDSNLNFVWDFVVTSIQFLKTTVGLIF